MTVKTVSLYQILKSIPLPSVSATRRIPAYGAARVAHGTITLGDPREARYTITGIAPAMLDERAEAVVDARALLAACRVSPTSPILPGPTPGSLSVNGITIPGLDGLAVGDIPMPKLVTPCTVIRAGGLAALYSLTPAMGTDITSDTLRGAWIDGAEGTPLMAWASDGHRAHGIPVPEDSVEGVVPRRVTIPARDLAVAKACKATSIGLGETRTDVGGVGYAGIEIHVPGGASIRSQGPTRGDSSPDMSQLISTDPAKGAMPVPLTLAAQLKTLQTAVKVAGHPGAAGMINASGAVCLLTSEGCNPAPASLRGMAAILKWHRENPAPELFLADVPTCGEAVGDVIVRANPSYLIDAIDFVGSGTDATLATRSAGDPIMLRHTNGRIALVMPVR